MCLRFKVENPEVILSEGTHAGHEFVTVHNGRRYRCGYVKVEPGHPWHGKGWEDISASVHGGITFHEADVKCEKDGPDSGWWVGFDCAHSGDGQDPELPWTDGGEPYDFSPNSRPHSQEDVDGYCRELCQQAADATLVAPGGKGKA
jgi:hypothetical protein